MQADNVEAGSKDLVRKLINLNPIEAHSAINQYFDNAALLESREYDIKGAERIKKQFDLFNHAFKESDLVGQPKWSERDQTIDFTYARVIEGPQLIWPLRSLPLVKRLSRARKTIHYDGSLHLNPDGRPKRGEAAELLVTKYTVNRREKAPLENLIPYYLLRPFLGTVSNIIATVASIVLAFPFTPKGIVHMISSLINNFWLWFYDKVADRTETLFPQKPSWADGPGANLPGSDQLNTILSTAEGQAKKLGLPVERAKHLAQDVYGRAEHALGTMQGKANEVAKKTDEVTQDTGEQVKKTANNLKKKAEKKAPEVQEKAEQTAKQVQDKAQEAAEVVKEKRQETKENVEEAAEGNLPTGQAEAEPEHKEPEDRSNLPSTPFGGTDPLANGAPSYAGATEDSNSGFDSNTVNELANTNDFLNKDNQNTNNASSGKDDGSDVPSTPFGGSDPLAGGAPSYASATEDPKHGFHGCPVDANTHDNEASNENTAAESSGNKVDTSDLPSTPFGGTNPLADGAPSYAAAAH